MRTSPLCGIQILHTPKSERNLSSMKCERSAETRLPRLVDIPLHDRAPLVLAATQLRQRAFQDATDGLAPLPTPNRRRRDTSIEVGVNAVNQFYEYCGLPDRVRPESHIDYSELLSHNRSDIKLHEQERELRERLEAALALR
ncbi:hypothetical protein [Pelagicoccus mobilis]|uniref:Uncharacterized protein n=1 Tax=Pelagicoccus mobilis TaxID=415221 RepID=A0A934VPN0_9BACT|nr:hypothetical protein [Pelagicoccus mobilis]MBK1877462.1 hypothetical protein [Pelagicoccus mobilis]